MTLMLDEDEFCVFRGKMPWDEESEVRISGCDAMEFRMTIVSKVFGDSDLMVKQGEVRKADGLDDVVEDIFSEEKPRTSRFLNLFSDTEEEHENLKTLLDDIFEAA